FSAVIASIAIAFCCCLPSPADKPEAYEFKSEYDTVTLPLEKGWVLGQETKLGSIRSLQFVPGGESVQKFTRSITLSTLPGMNRAMSARAWMREALDQFAAMPLLKRTGKVLKDDTDNDVTYAVIAGESTGQKPSCSIMRCLTGTD